MVHLLSALIVGSIYGGGYSLRGGKLGLYKLSIIMLCVYLVAAVGGFLLEDGLYGMIGQGNWGIFSYAREVLVYSLWLQSLICAALSVASFINARHWRYLAGSVAFALLFLVLAYATSTQAMALPLG
jgi:hypothetical protein